MPFLWPVGRCSLAMHERESEICSGFSRKLVVCDRAGTASMEPGNLEPGTADQSPTRSWPFLTGLFPMPFGKSS